MASLTDEPLTLTTGTRTPVSDATASVDQYSYDDSIVRSFLTATVLSWLHFWGWQGIIASAAITLPLGITQSKEYAELEWPIDIAIAVVWLGFFGGNFLMTLIHRRERHLYIALWFTLLRS